METPPPASPEPGLPAAPKTRKLAELSHEEMSKIISGLARTKRMHAEMYIGIEFFNWMLANHGVKGVAETVEKIHHILNMEGKLDRYDLENTAADMGYRKVGRKVSRRDFLRTAGWSIPGAVTALYGVAKSADEGTRAVNSIRNRHKAESDPAQQSVDADKRTVFGKVSDWITNNLAPPTEALIGAALINEGIHEWHEIKLDQIANAAAELAEIGGLQKLPRRKSGKAK